MRGSPKLLSIEALWVRLACSPDLISSGDRDEAQSLCPIHLALLAQFVAKSVGFDVEAANSRQ